jgi:uncharacterized protein involved in exopolysaccharide biosynthesis
MKIAEKKKRNPTTWLVIGFLGGLIAILVVAFLPPI